MLQMLIVITAKIPSKTSQLKKNILINSVYLCILRKEKILSCHQFETTAKSCKYNLRKFMAEVETTSWNHLQIKILKLIAIERRFSSFGYAVNLSYLNNINTGKLKGKLHMAKLIFKIQNGEVGCKNSLPYLSVLVLTSF